MTSIGVVCALPAEARTLPGGGRAGPRPVELFGDHWLIVSGVGPEPAAAAARALEARGVQGLLSWGLAGGLDARLRPGDLVVPERVLPAEGSAQAATRGWSARLRERLAGTGRIWSGAIAESARVVASRAGKAALFESTGALAVDMESAALARQAERAGLAFAAVRVVCDPARRSLPASALAAVDPSGAVRPARVARALLRRPQELLAVLALARQARAAEAVLRRAARAVGPDLAAAEERV